MRVSRRQFCQLLTSLGVAVAAPLPVMAEYRDVTWIDGLRVNLAVREVGMLLRHSVSDKYLAQFESDFQYLAKIDLTAQRVEGQRRLAEFQDGIVVIDVPGAITLIASNVIVDNVVPLGMADSRALLGDQSVLMIRTPLLTMANLGREEVFATGVSL